MKTHATTCCMLALCLSVTGCATGNQPADQVKGAALGCGVGAALDLLSPIISSAALSCLTGAAAGLTVTTLLDLREQRALAEARVRAAESNQRVDWSAPPPENPGESNSPETAVSATAPTEASAAATTSTPTTASTTVTGAPATAPGGAPAVSAPSQTPPRKTVSTKSMSSPARPAAPTASGWIIPVRKYVAKNGNACSDLRQHVEKGGKKIDENLTLCKTAAGWIIPQKSG